MIGKGSSISHTRAAVAYGLKESKGAEIVYKQHVSGGTAKEITQEFAFLQQYNLQCRKNTLSFILSPTIKDGQRMDDRAMGEIIKRFLGEMKLLDHQAVAVVHRDREHVHLHIYANRINFQGKAYDDSFVGNRSSLAAEIVARSMGYTTVKEVQQQKLEETKELRAEIRGIHEKVIERERPRDFDAYMQAMEQHGIKVLPHINKQNELQGFRFAYGDQNLKGSQVHPSMSMGNLAAKLDFGKEDMVQMATGKTMRFLGSTVNVSARLAQVLADRLAGLAQRMDKEMQI